MTAERHFFAYRHRSLWTALIALPILSKFSLLLNSSFGAFMFQAVIETLMLIGVLFAITFLDRARVSIGGGRRRTIPAE